MSFGWAPSGDPLSRASFHRVNFFSRLEADLKRKRLILNVINGYLASRSQSIAPSRKRKRNSALSLRDMIAEDIYSREHDVSLPMRLFYICQLAGERQERQEEMSHSYFLFVL